MGQATKAQLAKIRELIEEYSLLTEKHIIRKNLSTDSEALTTLRTETVLIYIQPLLDKGYAHFDSEIAVYKVLQEKDIPVEDTEEVRRNTTAMLLLNLIFLDLASVCTFYNLPPIENTPFSIDRFILKITDKDSLCDTIIAIMEKSIQHVHELT